MTVNNVYVKDTLSRVRHYRTNWKFDNIINSLKTIDPIKNYMEFKEAIKPYLHLGSGEKLLSRQELGEEGLLYGHRNVFFEYAGVKTDQQRFIFPAFEHGADLRGTVNGQIYERFNHSFVFQSDYKNEFVHKIRPYAPVYNIGPYILYARDYYDEQEKKRIKDQCGKTVLLFPAHSFEGASVEFDKKRFVKEVMKEFRNEFDTILVCVYWKDVEEPVYTMFENEGAKLVSAGFRGDPNFIVRQKSLIDISDLVASNLTGSYIGYALALHKPFYMFQEQAKLNSSMHILNEEQVQQYDSVVNKIRYAFSSVQPSSEQIQLQQEVFRTYWGGDELFKTPDEAKAIIKLSSHLLKMSGGNSRVFENVVLDIINNRKKIDDDLFEILKKSIGVS